jgi:hypothetical protein
MFPTCFCCAVLLAVDDRESVAFDLTVLDEVVAEDLGAYQHTLRCFSDGTKLFVRVLVPKANLLTLSTHSPTLS